MHWKKLKTHLLFSHPRLNVYEDDVQLPNGHLTKYMYFGDVPDAVTIIAVNTNGEVLLQKEYSYPQDKCLFQFPGGAIEKGETPLSGGKRELAEEAQLTGRFTKIGWFYPENRRKTQRMHVFVATDLQAASAEKDIEEEFEDFWYSVEKINELIQGSKINNYSTLAAWAMFVNTAFYKKNA